MTKAKTKILHARIDNELMKGFNETVELINQDPISNGTATKTSLLKEAIRYIIKKYNKRR
jgi:hypothetical protein